MPHSITHNQNKSQGTVNTNTGRLFPCLYGVETIVDTLGREQPATKDGGNLPPSTQPEPKQRYDLILTDHPGDIVRRQPCHASAG